MPTRTAQSIALNTRKRPKEFLSEFTKPSLTNKQ